MALGLQMTPPLTRRSQQRSRRAGFARRQWNATATLWRYPTPLRLSCMTALAVGCTLFVVPAVRWLPTWIGYPIAATWLCTVLALVITAFFVAVARPSGRWAQMTLLGSFLLATSSLAAQACRGVARGGLTAVAVLSFSVVASILVLAVFAAAARSAVFVVDSWRRSRAKGPVVDLIEEWLIGLPRPTRAVVFIGAIGAMWRLLSWMLLLSSADNRLMRIVETVIESVVPWLNSIADTMMAGGLVGYLVYVLGGEDHGSRESPPVRY